jgi:hypothetical protein
VADLTHEMHPIIEGEAKTHNGRMQRALLFIPNSQRLLCRIFATERLVNFIEAGVEFQWITTNTSWLWF